MSSIPVGTESVSSVTPSSMTFHDHLAELRTRLMICTVTLVLTTGGVFAGVTPIIRFLQRLTPPETLFVQLTPGEVFISSFKLSMLAGVGLSLPVILYHVFRFMAPGLKPHERVWLLPLLLLALLLFFAGLTFGYYGILPVMLTFLLDYGQTVAQNQLSIAAFLDFCMGFLFAAGLVFQVPILALCASWLGLVKSAQLFAQWKVALVASFVVGAVITPTPDPFSQLLMAGCLFLLYGVSVLLVRLTGR